MKNIFIMVPAIFAAVFSAFGQNNAKIIEEIKKADRQWQVESYGSRDLKDYDRIVAEDFLITGTNGKVSTRAQKRASVAADYTDPATTAASPDFIFKIDEASHQVRVFDKTAVSNGYIIEKYVYKGNKINSRVYFTCTYLKRRGNWQVVAAHYSRINQP